MTPPKELTELERSLNIKFRDKKLLEKALTHGSIADGKANNASYERLEFLGDRVLGLSIAEMVFSKFPDDEEGILAVRYNRLVSGETCAKVAREISLNRYIRAGQGVSLEGRKAKSILADVCEALIAAIYLDQGLDVAKAFIETHWGDRTDDAVAAVRDAKSALQEWLQSSGHSPPDYQVVGRSGPDHAPIFLVKASWGDDCAEEGTGRSKREAEQDAATKILLREGVWPEGGAS